MLVYLSRTVKAHCHLWAAASISRCWENRRGRSLAATALLVKDLRSLQDLLCRPSTSTRGLQCPSFRQLQTKPPRRRGPASGGRSPRDELCWACVELRSTLFLVDEVSSLTYLAPLKGLLRVSLNSACLLPFFFFFLILIPPPPTHAGKMSW